MSIPMNETEWQRRAAAITSDPGFRARVDALAASRVPTETELYNAFVKQEHDTIIQRALSGEVSLDKATRDFHDRVEDGTFRRAWESERAARAKAEAERAELVANERRRQEVMREHQEAETLRRLEEFKAASEARMEESRRAANDYLNDAIASGRIRGY